MVSPSPSTAPRYTRSDHVRLRTLILLRWMAVFGQVLALAVAERYVGLALPLGACFLVVGASVIANLIATFLFPENKRLTESEAMVTFLFDISQLSVLLYLTGGLTNPFSLLLLAPVTIAATVLDRRTALFLGVVATLLVTVLAVAHRPLVFATGEEIAVAPLLEFGSWLALVIGIAFLGLYSHRVSKEIHVMADALLATQMALAREQKLTDLGGVVAAAAHELGTPLATITLVSAEMVDDLHDQPDLREDAALIRREAARCRDILHSMGRTGKDDKLLRQTVFQALVEEAADPHRHRGKEVDFVLKPPTEDAAQPTVVRKPEMVHGLRNLIQNAVDFARDSVSVELEWTQAKVVVRIIDDGPGFPSTVIGRIGDPFVRSRRDATQRDDRPGYEGMGLGLFIAKTLLERTGAELDFANGRGPAQHLGAIVTVTWPRNRIEADAGAALGENTQNMA